MRFFNNDLALSDAIEMAVAKIMGNYAGFFVSTEFGDIGIEVIRHEENLRTTRWSSAPFTKFYKNNRDSSTDFYMAVPRRLVANMDMLRLFVTREMLSIFIYQIVGRWPDRDLLDAVMLVYNEYITHNFHGQLIQSYIDFKFPRIGFGSKLQLQAREHAACMLKERYERIKIFIGTTHDLHIGSVKRDQRFGYDKGAMLIFILLLDFSGLKDDKLNEMPAEREGMTFTDLCHFYIER